MVAGRYGEGSVWVDVREDDDGERTWDGGMFLG